MNIDLSNYSLEDFNIVDVDFCGISSFLVIPKNIGINFNQQNKIFRSSIWSKDGALLSAGFPKFTNFGENPENFPVPLNVNNVNFVTKIDGSLTIIDYINNTLSMRTRGTTTYKTLENYQDFESCINQYSKIESWLKTHSNYSLLCEITTPNLKIILDYGDKPNFWLIGCVNKNDYSLMTQKELNQLAIELDLPRPKVHQFNSIDDAVTTIKQWNDAEGVCLYSNNDQTIHKIKADFYLKLHRFKSEASLENTLNMYIEAGRPSYTDFEKLLIAQFDYECFSMVRGFASAICDATKEVDMIIRDMQSFIEKINKTYTTRKERALSIIKNYDGSSKKAMCFTLLDEKPLTIEQMTKLYHQVLKTSQFD